MPKRSKNLLSKFRVLISRAFCSKSRAERGIPPILKNP
jgi:hypothetical protein